MNKIIAIYGPTTSNKLGLALNLSKYIWGKHHIEPEVVNTDSRKVYRGFVISQGLPTEAFREKVKTHLFGTTSPRKKLDLFDFQKLVSDRVFDIQQRGNLPILVGGSSLHLLAVLQNWKKNEKPAKRNLPPNVLVFGMTTDKPTLKRAVDKNVSNMIKSGLYEEFKELYQKSQKGKVAKDLLEETLGYRQFLEMARVAKKSPLELDPKDLAKVKKWVIKDILDYAYHQTLDCKNFSGIYLVRDFSQARKIADSFLGTRNESGVISSPHDTSSRKFPLFG